MSISDISFDDDDFEMDFKAASPLSRKKEKPDTSPLHTLSFEDANEKYQKLQKQMENVDAIAAQLKFALELRVKMEECPSSRTNSDSLISTRFEIRSLSSESFLFIFHLKNNSSQALSDWYIILNCECLDTIGISSSHSLQLSYLESNQTKSFELFLAKNSAEMPILVRSKLVRKFDLYNAARVIRIGLDRDIITHLNFLKHAPANGIDKKTSFGTFSHTIPTSLVNLLSGCPDVVQPGHLLNFVFGVGNPSSSLSIEQASANASIDLFQTSHQIRVEVEKEFKALKVVFYVKDTTLRRALQRDFELLVIVRSSELLNRPPNQAIEWQAHNERTINDVFLNIIERFS